MNSTSKSSGGVGKQQAKQGGRKDEGRKNAGTALYDWFIAVFGVAFLLSFSLNMMHLSMGENDTNDIGRMGHSSNKRAARAALHQAIGDFRKGLTEVEQHQIKPSGNKGPKAPKEGDGNQDSFMKLATLDCESTSTKADNVGLSEVSRRPPSLLTGWRHDGFLVDRPEDDIAVTLVTQCSLDRLPNMKEQLFNWKGRASIAVYLKPSEDTKKAASDILAALDNGKASNSLDVAITLVKGYKEGESYPINYLRNIALLESQKQHLRFAPSLDEAAVLLVDIDFRPSTNLHEMLHTKHAADLIINKGKAVVCPAFEYWEATCPRTVHDLKKLVDADKAEAFHYSRYPPGHGPTQFDKFWEISLNCTTASGNSSINEQDCFWDHSYKVQHEDGFEPYIVMASRDVPLFDERFQGYGFNKIPHLDSVAKAKNGEYVVLPGVFLAAPEHRKSEHYRKVLGGTEEAEKNHRAVRDLYKEFLEELEEGQPPVVSKRTSAMKKLLSTL